MRPNPLRSCLLLACLLAVLAAPAAVADQAQRATWITVEGGCLPSENFGYGVSNGGFAPICFDPVENSSYSFPPDAGRDLGSTWGSAAVQVSLFHRLLIPFLAGEGALTSGNSLSFSFTGVLTPVSARLEAQATLNPIAFLNVFTGGMVGTGWDTGWFNGLGLNADGTGIPESASFQAVVSQAWVGAALQFDLAALLPGDCGITLQIIDGKICPKSAFTSGPSGGAGNTRPRPRGLHACMCRADTASRGSGGTAQAETGRAGGLRSVSG